MKLLICPGLPRCGTTYLYQELARSGLFNVPVGKETNYFLKSEFDPATFLALYPSHSPDRYYLDFSPSYLIAPQGIYHIVAAYPKVEIKVVLCLRNPIERAFAHYLHDVRVHVATREWGENVYYPLFCSKAIRRYMIKCAPAITALVNAIGRENILVINFHRDLKDDMENLQNKLGRFLKTEGFPMRSNVVGEGGWIPRYLYGEMDVLVDNEIRILPAETMLLVNGPYSQAWPNMSRERALTLLHAATSWQREMPAAQASMLESLIFEDDFAETLSLLGIGSDLFPANFPLTSKEAELPQLTAASFPRRCHYSDRLRDILGRQ